MKRKNNKISIDQMVNIFEKSITLAFLITSNLDTKTHGKQVFKILDTMVSELIIYNYISYGKLVIININRSLCFFSLAGDWIDTTLIENQRDVAYKLFKDDFIGLWNCVCDESVEITTVSPVLL